MRHKGELHLAACRDADTTLTLANLTWQVHAAPGHDPHSVVLFQPDHRLLISADALWENGFGVVFPELDGEDAFDEVGATLDLIERLAPLTVIPLARMFEHEKISARAVVGGAQGVLAGGAVSASQPFTSSSALRSRLPAACFRRSTFRM